MLGDLERDAGVAQLAQGGEQERLDALDRVLQRPHALVGLVAHAPHHRCEALAHAVVVVDDEDVGHGLRVNFVRL